MITETLWEKQLQFSEIRKSAAYIIHDTQPEDGLILMDVLLHLKCTRIRQHKTAEINPSGDTPRQMGFTLPISSGQSLYHLNVSAHSLLHLFMGTYNSVPPTQCVPSLQWGENSVKTKNVQIT